MSDRESSPLKKNMSSTWLGFARAVWILSFILVTMIFVLGLVGFHLTSIEPCSQKIAEDQADCYAREAVLQGLGLSSRFYSFYFPIGVIVEIMPWILVSLLIFLFKSHEPFAFAFSLLLLWFGAIMQDGIWRFAFYYYQPGWSAAFERLELLSTALVVLGYLFPDGRFVLRWTRWLALAWIGWVFFRFLFPQVVFNEWIYTIATSTSILSIIYAMVYRYITSGSPVQRQQIKWVVVSGTVYALVKVLQYLISPIALGSISSEIIFMIAYTPLTYIVSCLAAVSMGISILKYRLWEIDVIIRRTLVYGSLTALLIAVYLGSVISVQYLLFTLTGQRQSEIGTVIATLAVAALFTPFRRMLQNAIDRRFYRRKYDAEQVLAAFSASLREEVDLDRLSERLASVADETMQPEHVSAWLRKPMGKNLKTFRMMGQNSVPGSPESPPQVPLSSNTAH